jgi:hypothetical protein
MSKVGDYVAVTCYWNYREIAYQAEGTIVEIIAHDTEPDRGRIDTYYRGNPPLNAYQCLFVKRVVIQTAEGNYFVVPMSGHNKVELI